MTPEETKEFIDAAMSRRASIDAVYFVLSPVVTLLLYHLIAYLKQKGQNLATREDVEEITNKIESTKAVYSRDIEMLRSDLSTRSQTTTLRFKKELEVFELIWSKLHELKEKVMSLRPIMDTSLGPEETEDQRKKQRAIAYTNALEDFFDVVQHNRPFYPHGIWEALKELKQLTWGEAVDWRFETDNRTDYWDKAMKNQNAISMKVDALADLIRSRLADYK